MKNVFLIFLASFMVMSQGVFAQINLIRNGGFEQGPSSKPDNISQLDKAKKWTLVEYPFINSKGDPDVTSLTSDWFSNVPGRPRPMTSCGPFNRALWEANGNTNFFSPYQGRKCAGTLMWHDDFPGEVLQQKLKSKLSSGGYRLSFHYAQPCDTFNYRFKLYFGEKKDQFDYLAFVDSVPAQTSGQWYNYSKDFFLPEDKKYKWFLLAFDGRPRGTASSTADGAYMYYDEISLEYSPLNCPDCSIHGPISSNQYSWNQFTPNGDGKNDEWCVYNINNATSYIFEIKTRSGSNVLYNETGSNPEGFFNLNLCWDGLKKNGNPVPFGEYLAYIELSNCDQSTSRLFYITKLNDPAADSIVQASNYIPPPMHFPTSPQAHNNLYLYGGPYGPEVYRACDTIFAGDMGNPMTPYYIVDSNGAANHVTFKAREMVVLGDGFTVLPTGNFSAVIDTTIECCASRLFRKWEDQEPMQSPGTAPNQKKESEDRKGESSELELLPKSAAFPNPFLDQLEIRSRDNSLIRQVSVIDLSGRSFFRREGMSTIEIKINTRNWPTGLYFLEIVFEGRVEQKRIIKAK